MEVIISATYDKTLHINDNDWLACKSDLERELLIKNEEERCCTFQDGEQWQSVQVLTEEEYNEVFYHEYR